jgi:hypothetical protein
MPRPARRWSGVQSPGAAPGEYNLLGALLLECLVLPGGGVVLSHQVLHQVVHSDNLPAPLKPVNKFAFLKFMAFILN